METHMSKYNFQKHTQTQLPEALNIILEAHGYKIWLDTRYEMISS